MRGSGRRIGGGYAPRTIGVFRDLRQVPPRVTGHPAEVHLGALSVTEPELDAARSAAQANAAGVGGVHAVKGRQGHLQGQGGGHPHHPQVADQQDMAFGVFVEHGLDARSDTRVESVEGLRARRAMIDGVPKECVVGIGVGLPQLFMAAPLPGAEAHLPKAPVHHQRQAVTFCHGLGEVATALQRGADHMGPVGELPYRSPHLGPAALAQGIVHCVTSVTQSSVWLTVAQKVYGAHGSACMLSSAVISGVPVQRIFRFTLPTTTFRFDACYCMLQLETIKHSISEVTMFANPQAPRINILRGWQDCVESAVLRAIALAHDAIEYVRVRATDCFCCNLMSVRRAVEASELLRR